MEANKNVPQEDKDVLSIQRQCYLTTKQQPYKEQQ